LVPDTFLDVPPSLSLVEGQTSRAPWAILRALGVFLEAAPPVQGDHTAVLTVGPNYLRVKPWLIDELAQEAAHDDRNGLVHTQIMSALFPTTVGF
jgi:hypothetical protein